MLRKKLGVHLRLRAVKDTFSDGDRRSQLGGIPGARYAVLRLATIEH